MSAEPVIRKFLFSVKTNVLGHEISSYRVQRVSTPHFPISPPRLSSRAFELVLGSVTDNRYEKANFRHPRKDLLRKSSCFLPRLHRVHQALQLHIADCNESQKPRPHRQVIYGQTLVLRINGCREGETQGKLRHSLVTISSR